MMYEYKCPGCKNLIVSGVRADRLAVFCFTCDSGVHHRRVFSLAVHRPMQEHWNDTVGAPVSDMKDFREKLKIQGEQYTERTGIASNFQPVDMGDRKTLGVSADAGET